MQNIHKHMIASIILSLLIVLFFISPSIYNQLFETVLGRAFLVMVIIFMSCCNEYLALFFVVFLIILYNKPFAPSLEESGGFQPYNTFNSTYVDQSIVLEGLTPMSEGNNSLASALSANINNAQQMLQSSIGNHNDRTTPPVQPKPNTPTDSSKDSSNHKKNKRTETPNSKKSTALEGFDLLGKETNLQRGKQSKSIPVGDFMRDSKNVLPYDESIFTPFSV